MYLEKISESLKQASVYIEKIALRRQKKENLKKLQEEIDFYTQNTEEFLTKPNELSNLKNNTKYSHTIYLYVCLKQVVALFEAEAEALPIQIFNEFRNAFDHFSRGLINQNDSESHIKKMEGHVQRAFLDTCKLTCFFYQDRVNAIHRRYPRKSLSLVSNGEYLKKYSELEAVSKLLLVDARENDFNLTDDGHKNKDILVKYLRALLSYKQLTKYQTDNIKNLFFNKYKYYFLKGLSIGAVFLLGVLSSILGTLLLLRLGILKP